MTLVPGTYEFEKKLIARVRQELNPVEPARLVSRELYSRNTLIYRLSIGDRRFVAKIQLSQQLEELATEYEVLKDLETRLSGDVASLKPVAFFPELYALVTVEEQGLPLRYYVDESIRSGSEETRVKTRRFIRRAAAALHRFHFQFGIDPDERQVRQYLDYSPRNVLIKDDRAVILMDPPEHERFGSVHEDLGVFCFDLSRAAFMPSAIVRFPAEWLDALKFEFLMTYMRCLGRSLTESDLVAVRAGEKQRATNALSWYANFYKYRAWPREFARWAYFTPMISLYLKSGLTQSYRRLQRNLVS